MLLSSSWTKFVSSDIRVYTLVKYLCEISAVQMKSTKKKINNIIIQSCKTFRPKIYCLRSVSRKMQYKIKII